MRKNILASSKKLKRKRLIFKLVFSAVCLSLLAACAAWALRIPKFRIQKILIKGNSTIETNDLTGAVSKSLSGNYYFLFPKNNIFIFPKKEIENGLLEDFSKIEKLSVKIDFPQTISVEIGEREISGLVCRGQDCAFIDSRGFVFQKAPYFSGNVFLKFYDERDDIENITSGVGQSFQLLPEDKFTKLVEFNGYLTKEKINANGIVLKNNGDYEFHANGGWLILLNDKNDPRASFENLKIALDSEIKEKISELEYIDLRFGNKVFYKFK